MKLDYNVIKKRIIKSCKQEGNTLKFIIDYDKLNSNVEEFGLIALKNTMVSKQVESRDIPLISEYFKREKLAWFNRSRHFLTLSFVVAEELDEKGQKLVDMLKDENRSKDPEFDRADIVAELLAYYPCYNATIVAYRSDDPNRLGKNSYTTIIRANINAIAREEYEYYNEDV